MITTLTEAAKELGMYKQTLWHKVQDGIVTAQKSGSVLLIDIEQARRELTEDGYFSHSRKWHRTRARNLAKQGQK